MDEINELGKYLRRSKESVEVKHPIPSKSGNTTWAPWFVVEMVLVIAFGMLLVDMVASLPPWLNIGMSKGMYVVTRVAAFACILAFLHLSLRYCLAGIDRSRGWVQWMGWGAVILTVVVLTLAAFIILLFFSFPNY